MSELPIVTGCRPSFGIQELLSAIVVRNGGRGAVASGDQETRTVIVSGPRQRLGCHNRGRESARRANGARLVKPCGKAWKPMGANSLMRHEPLAVVASHVEVGAVQAAVIVRNGGVAA